MNEREQDNELLLATLYAHASHTSYPSSKHSKVLGILLPNLYLSRTLSPTWRWIEKNTSGIDLNRGMRSFSLYLFHLIDFRWLWDLLGQFCRAFQYILSLGIRDQGYLWWKNYINMDQQLTYKISSDQAPCHSALILFGLQDLCFSYNWAQNQQFYYSLPYAGS